MLKDSQLSYVHFIRRLDISSIVKESHEIIVKSHLFTFFLLFSMTLKINLPVIENTLSLNEKKIFFNSILFT